MENASKALIMAGGILIALLVIGALLLMFNQIGSYEKAQTSNVKDSQLAQFNSDFERYTDDSGIQGVDIISIINKVVDFNKKTGVSNSVNYDIKMTVEVSGLTGENGFVQKYPVSTGTKPLFTSTTLKMGEESNNKNRYFAEVITEYTNYENTYGLSVMSTLASNYNDIKEKMGSKITEGSKEYYKLVEEIIGKKVNQYNFPSLSQISQYKQYSEFKSATFKSDRNPDYENGQIKKLYFKFVK